MERMTGVPGGGAALGLPGLVAAARALTDSADYGSLALWGGRVAHGLRFTSRCLSGSPSPNAPARLTDPARADQPEGPPTAGPSAGGQPCADSSPAPAPARDLPTDERPAADPAAAGAGEHVTGVEQIAGLDATWPTEPVTRLLVLAPAAIGHLLGDDDQACRFQFCGPVAGRAHWVSIAFGGWVAAVPAVDAARLTAHFADRHPTADLFDLGERWTMLEIDVVEAIVRTEQSCTHLDTEDARSLLTS
ncbi:hypothetical protein I6A84_24495 [Frankia sp. CNm7]|uniref:Uncharacterized protein n=1 Tax=Frankia nepalensis TaxID=1836974 RepID=A0A937RQC2_9ACTN|nr:hypothetical protein [Frankia nepalensis]MBL7495571.1 hypothetical protein [Frankia nepalensis]MBL7508817.1 hypothetical protein [Frankia nepalensis]MBL7521163.1 hypothetical protein [Frankia nepalensis]MBL7630041.1 hypothetical protein [Frankia nepalensis]